MCRVCCTCTISQPLSTPDPHLPEAFPQRPPLRFFVCVEEAAIRILSYHYPQSALSPSVPSDAKIALGVMVLVEYGLRVQGSGFGVEGRGFRVSG